jgi:hypothetical protein
MAKLDNAALERRLRLDERTMALVNVDPAPIRVTAHAGADAARRGTNAIEPGSTASAPEHYRVAFDFDTLTGRDVRHRPTVVHIDVLGNRNYPFSEPVCRVTGTPLPWTPHFDANWPICIGDGWDTSGKALLVDLVVHIAKLLNFDEPPPRPGYHGYNGAAIEWWVSRGCRPLDPNLRYPTVDPNAVAGRTVRFQQHGGNRFSAAGAAR